MTSRWLAALLLWWSIGPSLAMADGRIVLLRLPVERRDELTAALRLELAGRASLIAGPALSDDVTLASIRAEATASGATHAIWIVFPGGVLAPAEVRVLDVSRTSAIHAMTPQAWDVVDARVVAVLAASLLETGDAPERPRQARAIEEPSVQAAPPILEVVPPAPSPPALELTEPVLAVPRRARTFSLLLAGVGIAHTSSPASGDTISPTGHVAFYGRLSEWASIGLRLRGGAGYSSLEGAIADFTIGLPSIAVAFREPLGTAAMLEVGMHVEGGLHFSAAERLRNPQILFGLGVGAFATLELGAANGLQLDYTLVVFGFGEARVSSGGALTLAYVHRWD